MTTERVAPSINPWQVAQQQFDAAAERLNMDPGLREVLREVPVAHEAEHVVVDGLLVRPDDQGERPLVAALRLAKDPRVWLCQRHGFASIQTDEVNSRTIYER